MEHLEYVVGESQKRLWKIELQISQVLLDICHQFNLRIWACYGTLLGAARHKGFIPWDDDMDFVMMREDYDKLFDLISSKSSELVLPDGYEFDITNIRAIKLRDKNTTMKPPRWKYSPKISYGVWVDIICLDVAPDNLQPLLTKYESIKRKIGLYLNGKLGFYEHAKGIKNKLIHLFCRLVLSIRGSSVYRRRIEDHLRADALRYSGKKVWGYMIWSTMTGIKKIKMYDKAWFDETVYLPFGDFSLPCPKEYEKVLTTQYGEWRTPVMGASQHEGSYVNIDKPYADYIAEYLSQIPWWKRYGYMH